MIPLFELVMGGLYPGRFTPARIGAFSAFVIMIPKAGLTRENALLSLKEACTTTTMIFGIIIGVAIFKN